MYSAALCSHINNIYNKKLVEIQQQIAHPNQHMNTGNVIQIEAPDFDPDIDEALPIPAAQNIDYQETQGSIISTQKFAAKATECRTPASSHQDVQDVDWCKVVFTSSANSLKLVFSFSYAGSRLHLLSEGCACLGECL